ncbi:hypothetical protein VitviT2T_006655 [Vitis vinifera]|uniref:Clu domain-containing protein n=1 Tax=Vitis vinifera TaxID=29760 RepID=A0ABY9BX15_VITVI|nr:hypothetical protein VitviT2T_006655 [Vitis vinifera]
MRWNALCMMKDSETLGEYEGFRFSYRTMVFDALQMNARSVSGAPCSCAHNAKEESASGITTSLRSVKEADVPRLHNLAMAIIDYKGYRAVVQSVLPGTLQGDKSDFFSCISPASSCGKTSTASRRIFPLESRSSYRSVSDIQNSKFALLQVVPDVIGTEDSEDSVHVS